MSEVYHKAIHDIGNALMIAMHAAKKIEAIAKNSNDAKLLEACAALNKAMDRINLAAKSTKVGVE